jgi:hypothetical protein
MHPISNLNSVLIKNYGQKQETLAVIRELNKLGLIKSKSKAKKERKPQMIEDLKQESDMVGYTKTLEGKRPTQFPLRLIESGMNPQQIEDINRVNSARFAQLESAANIQQQQIGGLAGMAQGFFSVINPRAERFRGSTFPAQQSGDEPIDPFASRRPNVIFLSGTPETQDVPLTRTANPNAPEVEAEFATTTFPVEETGNISTAPPNLQPREKVGGGSKKKKILVLSPQDMSDELGLGKIPTMRNSDTAVENYYIALTDRGIGDRNPDLKTKTEILAEIKSLLADAGKAILN